MRYLVALLNIFLWLAFIPVVIEEGFTNGVYFNLIIIGILIVPPLSALVIWLYTTDEESSFLYGFRYGKRNSKTS